MLTEKKEARDKIQPYTFKPVVSQISARLAQKSRSRQSGANSALDNNVFSTIQALPSESLQKRLHSGNLKTQEWVKQQQEIKLKAEQDQCTFKPVILESRRMSTVRSRNGGESRRSPLVNSQRSEALMPRPNPTAKYNQLYIKGSQALRKKRDKTSEEVEFERAKKECTFKPKIIEPKLKSTTLTSLKTVSPFSSMQPGMESRHPEVDSENQQQSKIISNLLRQHFKN